jgi:PAS domain S-box-containing protein
MRLFHKRISVFTGFVLLLAVLVINMAITRKRIGVQNNSRMWVEHTQQVLLELGMVESLLKDAESGQRGFLYTGKQDYLEPYKAALSRLDEHINKLAKLTADNPEEQARIPILRRLVTQKRDGMARTIDLAQSGKREEAKALVLSGVGKEAMDNIRALAQEMRQEEDSLLVTRLEDVRTSGQSLVRTVYLSTALAVIGLMLLAFYIVRAMEQRERYSAAIREREQWFRVTLSSIGDAVIATDEHGKVTFMNEVAQALTGIKPEVAQGQLIQRVFPIFNEVTLQPVENPVAKVLELGRIMGLANHTVLQRSDGKIIPIKDSAAPIYDDQKKLRGVIMVFRDVTAEKESEDLLHKAEKLAAAGRLAATVAHEINNPLEAVCNLIYLVKSSADLSEEVQSYLSLAEQELERVSHITRQTLGFYRDSAMPTAVEVSMVVESVIKLFENKTKSKDVSVEVNINSCPPVQGLQGELKQLVANLISNAADAVGTGGRIRVSAWPAVYPQGEGVEIKVADDGPGVAEENREQIFEPFFTTKRDIGTGLGLWVSKQIAERHHGLIRVANGGENDLGGAIFTVFLPRAQDQNAA